MSYPYETWSPLDTMSTQSLQMSPWQRFNSLWTSVTGFPAESLNVTPGVTPLLSLGSSASILSAYYAMIFLGPWTMRRRQAFKLNGLFLIHNFYLTVLSGILLVLFVEQLVPTIWRHGLFFTICHQGGWTDPLVVLYYVGEYFLIVGPKSLTGAVELLDQIS